MKRSTQDLIMAALFMLVCGAFLIASFKYGPRARLVPVPVAAISIALVLIDLFFERVLKRRAAVNADELFIKGKPSSASCETDKAVRQDGHPEWAALVIVALMLVSVVVLGIVGGLFVFVFGFFKFVNKANVLKSALWGVGVSAAVYVVFGLALKVVFYKGVLSALVG